jgi:hypothetical protein
LQVKRVFTRPWLIFVSLIFGLLLSVILTALWIAYGFVVGQEICPHTLKIRNFWYWQPLFFNQGIYKTESIDDTFAVALSLTDALPPTTEQRWDLAQDNLTSPLSRDLQAGFLADLLSHKSGVEYYWVTWSTTHPELAKRFWPLVSRLAVDRFYVILPEIFSVALSEGNSAAGEPSGGATPPADRLESRLYAVVQQELRWMLEEAQAAGDLDRQQRLEAALSDYQPPGGQPPAAADSAAGR